MAKPLTVMPDDPRPIGMLDSGVGGLSVMQEVRSLLPNESIIYLGDEGHMPYGPRPRDEIRAFVVGIIHFLIDQGCKLIVIPCNSANAAALHYAREVFPTISIVGMEPAIKPAAEHTKTGVVGVISTKATYQGELFASVIDRFANGVKIETQVSPDLVLLVERGAPDNAESRAIIAHYLEPLKAAGIDELVLACTHFPFLNAQLRAQLGPDVEIIDPGPAVARQVGRILEQQHISAPATNKPSIRYVTTGDPAHFRELLATLIHEDSPDIAVARWTDTQLSLPLQQVR